MKSKMRKFTILTNGFLHFKKGNAESKIDIFDIADAFEKYGGSFMKAIGTALRRADCVNQAKIVNTRPKECEEIANQFIFKNKNDE